MTYPPQQPENGWSDQQPQQPDGPVDPFARTAPEYNQPVNPFGPAEEPQRYSAQQERYSDDGQTYYAPDPSPQYKQNPYEQQYAQQPALPQQNEQQQQAHGVGQQGQYVAGQQQQHANQQQQYAANQQQQYDQNQHYGQQQYGSTQQPVQNQEQYTQQQYVEWQQQQQQQQQQSYHDEQPTDQTQSYGESPSHSHIEEKTQLVGIVGPGDTPQGQYQQPDQYQQTDPNQLRPEYTQQQDYEPPQQHNYGQHQSEPPYQAPVSAYPASAAPASAAPASGQPFPASVSSSPFANAPVSGHPASAAPASGQPWSSPPQSSVPQFTPKKRRGVPSWVYVVGVLVIVAALAVGTIFFFFEPDGKDSDNADEPPKTEQTVTIVTDQKTGISFVGMDTPWASLESLAGYDTSKQPGFTGVVGQYYLSEKDEHTLAGWMAIFAAGELDASKLGYTDTGSLQSSVTKLADLTDAGALDTIDQQGRSEDISGWGRDVPLAFSKIRVDGRIGMYATYHVAWEDKKLSETGSTVTVGVIDRGDGTLAGFIVDVPDGLSEELSETLSMTLRTLQFTE